MEIELTSQQIQAQEIFRTFVNTEIAPYADQCDQEEKTPPEMIKKLADAGYLEGGQNMEPSPLAFCVKKLGEPARHCLAY